MGRPNNQAGCTKFGKLINGQGAIRAGRVSNFSEINKQACPFIRQVGVLTKMNYLGPHHLDHNLVKKMYVKA